jgi:hypothetical protein
MATVKAGPTEAELEGRTRGECRGCQAPIYWVRINGKAHPVERGRETRVVFFEGAFHVVGAYVSHFAKCPNAAQFRTH